MIDVLQLINGFAGRYYFLDLFMILITQAGIVILFILLLLTKSKKIMIHGIAAFAIAYFIDLVFNLVYFTPRPQDGIFLVARKTDSSFPSTHAFLSFTLALIIFYQNKRIGIIALIIASLVAISRLFLAMHYLTDIAGGVILAVLVSYSSYRLLDRKI